MKTPKPPADDVIQMRIPAALKARYQAHCAARGEALTSWICGALADRHGRERFYAKAAAVRADFEREMRDSGAVVAKPE